VKEGSEVVAHYTVTGTEKTAVEVDKVGKGGYRVVEGTVTKVGEGGKTITVKAADGTEQTFEVAVTGPKLLLSTPQKELRRAPK